MPRSCAALQPVEAARGLRDFAKNHPVLIIKGVAIYNEFYIPWLYMPSSDLGVVATSLFRFRGPTSARWEVIAAAVVITMIPTLVAFLGLQRFIYNGFTRGVTK